MIHSNTDKYYKNVYNYYSPRMPAVYKFEKNRYFDGQKLIVKRAFFINFKKGDSFKSKKGSDFKTCLKHFNNGESVSIRTLYGKPEGFVNP